MELSGEFMDSFVDVETPEKAKLIPKQTSTPKSTVTCAEPSTSEMSKTPQTAADNGAGPSKTLRNKKEEASADMPVHQCDECGKTYKHYRTLHEHRRCYHRSMVGKKHKCPICDKKFNSECDLTSHHNSKHAKVKPYSCETCGRSYASPRSLFSSKHVCKGKVAPIACTQCDKTFSQKRYLTDHVRYSHTQAGCSCKVCFAHFKHREQLRRHVAKGCPSK